MYKSTSSDYLIYGTILYLTQKAIICYADTTSFGAMSERSMEVVLKTIELKGSGGSNPSRSDESGGVVER